MDTLWIKTLALSSYEDGRWHVPDPNTPAAIANEHLQEAFTVLFETVRSAIEVFNLHAPNHKQLKLYKLGKANQNAEPGFTMMMGPLQIQLQKNGLFFQTTAVLLNQSESKRMNLRSYEAKHDAFGDVFWLMNETIVLDLERLAKQVLEDACRLAYEVGVFKQQPPIDA